MADSPEGELFFDVNEFLGHFVGIPILFGVLIDGFEDMYDLIVGFVGLGEVAFDGFGGDGEVLTVEEAKEFVVDGWGFEGFGEFGVGAGVMFEDSDGLRVFVSEQEFDGSVLRGLESGCVAEDAAELDVFGGGEGFEDGPLFVEHALDVFDAGENFETGAEFVFLDVFDGGADFVNNEFHPKLRGLVLDDEKHFIVMGGAGEGFLGVEDTVEV